MTTTAACGTPAVFQGGYGSRGNLELLAPAPAGGITCCWFNSDAPEGPVTEPGIPAATWSAGLVFGADTGYDAVAGVQTVGGLLEVVASRPGGLDHWTWTPADGFTPTATHAVAGGLPLVTEGAGGVVLGVVVASGAGAVVHRWSAARHDDLVLDAAPVAVRAGAGGAVHVLLGRAGFLSLRTWHPDGTVTEAATPLPTGGPAALADGAAVTALDGELLVLDGDGLARHPIPTDPVDAVALAPSRMGAEHRLEVVTRSGTTLRHHRLDRGRA